MFLLREVFGVECLGSRGWCNGRGNVSMLSRELSNVLERFFLLVS